MPTAIGRTLLVCFAASICTASVGLAQDSATGAAELSDLKTRVAAQEQEIDQLRRALADQQKILERVAAGTVTGTAHLEPALYGPHPVAAPSPEPALPAVPQAAQTPSGTETGPTQGGTPSPLSFNIGGAKFTPIGFMDFTDVIRTTNVGSGIGTSFGSIPLNNSAAGNLFEDRFSVQNSRLGLRVDSNFLGADITGYVEADFLGNAPTNLPVTSNADTFRMRLYWLDFNKDKFEFLAGQSWSMLTPNREGLSPLPSNIFYSQDMDTNYQVGLTWTRAPQIRFIYHPTHNVAWGVSLENPEQYIGGAVTLPAGLATAYPTQFNVGSNTLAVPNAAPDVISKIAFDGKPGGLAMHFEVAGLLSTFRSYNPLNTQHFTKVGAGGAVNSNLELFKGFHLIENAFYSDGGGRYIYGLGPDLTVRPNGDISPIHAASTVDGFEYSWKPKDNPHNKETLFYAYYGAAYYQRNFDIDTTGAKPVLVGYGYPGSSFSANRLIQEYTAGVIQTFWKNPSYGDLKLITQYSYVRRDPWAASGTQYYADTNMIFLDLRYDLP